MYLIAKTIDNNIPPYPALMLEWTQWLHEAPPLLVDCCVSQNMPPVHFKSELRWVSHDISLEMVTQA
jgi:hypothetical protein